MPQNKFGLHKQGKRYRLGTEIVKTFVRKVVGKRDAAGNLRSERALENKVVAELRRADHRYSSSGADMKKLGKKIAELEKSGAINAQEAATAKQQIKGLLKGRPGSDPMRLLKKIQKPEPPPAAPQVSRGEQLRRLRMELDERERLHRAAQQKTEAKSARPTPEKMPKHITGTEEDLSAPIRQQTPPNLQQQTVEQEPTYPPISPESGADDTPTPTQITEAPTTTEPVADLDIG